MKFSSTYRTQPHHYVWSVCPEKRTNSPRHLHRLVNGQPLQRLYVESAVVELAFRTIVSMNTLPLTKHLSHKIALLSRAATAKK
jgi:hypothetical protein